MTLVFSGVFAPPLNGASITLGPGIQVVLGTEIDGTQALVLLAAGVGAPRRGSVRVSEVDPRSAPALRRRIGALFAEETLPPAATVSGALSFALRARNDTKLQDGCSRRRDLRTGRNDEPIRCPPVSGVGWRSRWRFRFPTRPCSRCTSRSSRREAIAIG